MRGLYEEMGIVARKNGGRRKPRGQRTEDRGQTTEGGRSEDGRTEGQKVRRRRTEDGIQKSPYIPL